MTGILIPIVLVVVAIALACVYVARALSSPACSCGGKVTPWKINNGWVCHCDGCNKTGPIGIDKKEAVENWRHG